MCIRICSCICTVTHAGSAKFHRPMSLPGKADVTPGQQVMLSPEVATVRVYPPGRGERIRFVFRIRAGAWTLPAGRFQRVILIDAGSGRIVRLLTASLLVESTE